MVSDILALPEPPSTLVELVARETEGNPFFVSEYLRAAVASRVLARDNVHAWRLDLDGCSASQNIESLNLPGTLRELIEQRFQRLTPGARLTAFSAAVIGREVDIELLRSVAGMSDEATLEAIDELLRREVLLQLDPERLRFVHDKLREVAYEQSEPAERKQFHARAAQALELRLETQPSSNGMWAALGHHFSAAEQPAQAGKYLRLAADHARSRHANLDAIRLYREALQQLDLEMGVSESGNAKLLRLEMQEALADVSMLTGQRARARAVYEEALLDESGVTSAARARILR
jgi:predicted ATPase